MVFQIAMLEGAAAGGPWALTKRPTINQIHFIPHGGEMLFILITHACNTVRS